MELKNKKILAYILYFSCVALIIGLCVGVLVSMSSDMNVASTATVNIFMAISLVLIIMGMLFDIFALYFKKYKFISCIFSYGAFAYTIIMCLACFLIKAPFKEYYYLIIAANLVLGFMVYIGYKLQAYRATLISKEDRILALEMAVTSLREVVTPTDKKVEVNEIKEAKLPPVSKKLPVKKSGQKVAKETETVTKTNDQKVEKTMATKKTAAKPKTTKKS